MFLIPLIVIVVISEIFGHEVCYWPPSVPENCAEVNSSGKDLDGVFKLQLGSLCFDAYCYPDPLNGPAWTIIQRRMDGSIDFFRDWVDYENGFGNINGEYWLGLRNIHELTQFGDFQLWVLLINYRNERRFARYAHFSVSDASTQYTLHVRGYYGDAGDSLKLHDGKRFHTRDRDINDCAAQYKGAWWMVKCYDSHLNGEYRTSTEKYTSGIKWSTWMNLSGSMKYTHMAIRPAEYCPILENAS